MVGGSTPLAGNHGGSRVIDMIPSRSVIRKAGTRTDVGLCKSSSIVTRPNRDKTQS